MPTYQYHSLTHSGDTRSGTLNAASRADAVRMLLNRGETATSILDMDGGGTATKTAPVRPRAERVKAAPAPRRPAKSAGAAAAVSAASQKSAVDPFRRLLGTGRPSLRRPELANLIRELATAIEAGLPLMQSLRTVRRQAHGKALPVILDHLIDGVERGDPLYQAAKDYGRPFDDMVVGMLRAADASGEMSKVMHQLADLLERSVELRREVMGATFYPMIVACLVVASVIVLVTVLVPRLIEPLEGQITIPWPTQVVLNIARFIESYWLLCLLGIGVAWMGWYAWSSLPANRYRIDLAKLRAPLMGRLLRDVAVARFTRTLGTLTSAGLPILDALRITRNTLGNQALMRAIDEVQDQVTSGKSLADPLERSGLFPHLLVQVVSLGERSGRLDSMLMHAATAFDRQVSTSINLFTKALPPLLLVVMACIGGFVLAAILLPLLELQSLVQ